MQMSYTSKETEKGSVEMGRQVKWSEDKISRMQAEGRGKGTGAQYQPWIEVADFSSRGNSRRVFSHKTNRVHHLFSDVEWHLFLLLEYAPDVIDIREQYPLVREDTIAIAAELGISHPTYPGTTIPEVMTSDFLVTRNTRTGPTLAAFNCKRTDEAEDARSLEKLEIQRSYFNGCDIPHHLVFHSMLPMTKVRNIDWIRSAQLRPDEQEPYSGFYLDHCNRLAFELPRTKHPGSVSEFCEGYDARTGAPPGTGLRAIRMLLSQRKLTTDLNEPDIAAAPVSMLHAERQGLRIVGGQ